MKNKTKKEKKVSQKERINQKVLNQHERLVNRLSKAEPDSDEYNELLKELERFETIQREKEKSKTSDKDSKRNNIGKTLINGGTNLLISVGLFCVEKNFPIVGKTADAFIKSIFKKP